jgi:uncharacterized lipoprotein YajG
MVSLDNLFDFMSVPRLPLLLILFTSGCALTTDTTELSYQPAKLDALIPAASSVRVGVFVDDERIVRDRVGVKKNGYGMEMAPIRAANDVPGVVKNAIQTALAKRGYQVGDAGLLVRVGLVKFMNDFKMGFWTGTAVGELIMNVEVRKSSGQIIYSKSVVGQGINSGEVIAGGSGAKTALELALQDGVAKLVDDPSFTQALLRTKS